MEYVSGTMTRQLAERLIGINSVTDNLSAMHEVLKVCETELKEFSVKRFESQGIPSLLVCKKVSFPQRFRVILNAHLDVVPGPEKMFSPKLRDGKLYGRGAQDMKGAAAVMVLLFKELADKVNYPLGLQLVTDEEVGGFHGTKYQIEKGIKADFVIAGEPTDFGVNNQAKGIIWLKIKTKGKAAHGAYPWNGENAIHQMGLVMEKFNQHFPVPSEEAWKTTANLAMLQTTNQTFNKVPEDCILGVDVRYIPADKEEILNRIKQILKGLAEIEVVVNEPCQFTDEQNQYVKKLRQATRKITGKPSKLIVKHGGSDIRLYNQVGCDGVTFGPIGSGLHTDEEWVSVKSLHDYYLILKQFLLSIN